MFVCSGKARLESSSMFETKDFQDVSFQIKEFDKGRSNSQKLIILAILLIIKVLLGLNLGLNLTVYK